MMQLTYWMRFRVRKALNYLGLLENVSYETAHFILTGCSVLYGRFRENIKRLLDG
jgi:hypothetical protein